MKNSLVELLTELGETPEKAYLFCGEKSLDSLVGFINGAAFINNHTFIDELLIWLKSQLPKYYHNGAWWNLCDVFYGLHIAKIPANKTFGQNELLHVIKIYLMSKGDAPHIC